MSIEIDDRIINAAEAVKAVYRYHTGGGNLHIATDDGNLDLGNLENCREAIAENVAGSSRRALKAEKVALDQLEALATEDDRVAACELAHGRDPYPDAYGDEDDEDEDPRSVADRAIDAIRAGDPIDREDFIVLIEAGYLNGSWDDRTQCVALFDAGWTPEPPTGGAGGNPYVWDQPMSWPWRRPSRRLGKPGRRFASTNQAYNAMMREKGDQTNGHRL